jgi:hypothetical protein
MSKIEVTVKIFEALLTAGFFSTVLMSCSGTNMSKLEFSEDEYKSACLVTRDGGKPSNAHVNYLKYEPAESKKNGVFMVAVYNPLGSMQLDCASVVFDGNGEKVVPAMNSLSVTKTEKDNKIKFLIVAYSDRPIVSDKYIAQLRLKKSNGDTLLYDTSELHNIIPVREDCVEIGCGFVYTKFVDAKINEADVPLFTDGNHAELSLYSVLGGQEKFAFNVPKN